MNKCVIIIIASFLFPISMHGQQQQFSLDSIINNSPANVKEYYRVFDSLARPTWKEYPYELWSNAELKKYASLIYEANEYDAVAKKSSMAFAIKQRVKQKLDLSLMMGMLSMK